MAGGYGDIAIKAECPDIIKLEKTFSDMLYADKKKILMSALRKATKPTLDMAIRTAPVSTMTNKRGYRGGNLRNSLAVLNVTDEIAVVLAARRKKYRPGWQGWHGHLVEDGTKARSYMTKKGVRHNTGVMPKNDFMKRAVEATGNEALNIMVTEWYNGIDKFHKKNGLK